MPVAVDDGWNGAVGAAPAPRAAGAKNSSAKAKAKVVAVFGKLANDAHCGSGNCR